MSRMEELLSSEESGQGAGTGWGKLVIAGSLVILLVLALVLPPLVNLNKYRRSLTASMSEALGRPVIVGGMSLRLLPTPGIVMSDFTVEEDPAFGYEPALHANSVVASLRLSSLWRGRLEVSRISLDEANLNLVRDAKGQWSIGSVLLRASQIPNAPTGARHAGPRPRFPYIEASDARIDFKDGVEKKPFSLMNAEFSMWQASGDEWRLRLKAQPVRTDTQLHMSDAGSLHLEGSLRRADNLLEMPVDLRVEWSGAQLGQVTELMAGDDSGWRGDLHATTAIQGTGGDLRLQTRLQITNLRRQEFQPPNSVDVDATCRSEYHHVERLLDNITCFWPVVKGHLLLTGTVNEAAPASTHLQLEINQVPTSLPVRLLALMRANAGNITTAGTVNGRFDWIRARAVSPGATTRDTLTGDATAADVSMSYPGGTLTLPAMHFVAEHAASVTAKGKKAAPPPAAAEEAVLLAPLPVPMGEAKPLVAEARLTEAGFELHLAGAASLARLMAVGGNFGLLEKALTAAAPKGHATVDTTTTGPWMPPLTGGSSGIATSGTVDMKNVELRPKFLRAPVEVESAGVSLTPDSIAWKDASFRYQGMAANGDVTFPVTCEAAAGCPVKFTLAAGRLSAATLETLVRGSQKGLLGEIFSFGGSSPGPWPAAQGMVTCDALELERLVIDHPTATVMIDAGKLTIASLTGKALGGTLDASGTMVVAGGAPQWTVNVQLNSARMNEAGALFHENWGGGTASGEAHLTMSGSEAGALASSAAGTFAFTWQNGGLATNHAGQEPLARFNRWTAKGTVAKSMLTITSSGVSRGAATRAVEGSIGFDRSVRLTLERRAGPVRIAGTLARPTTR